MSYPRGRHRIQRRLVREIGAGAEGRRELARFRRDLDQTDFEIVTLLMSELIANSVEHAGPDAGSHLLLDVTVTPDRIRVEVRDGGPGFVPTRRRLEENGIGLHWGLELVKRLSDRWQVVPGEGHDDTSVWFELDRGHARQVEAATG